MCLDLPKLDLQIDRGTDFKAWRAQWELPLIVNVISVRRLAILLKFVVLRTPFRTLARAYR